MFPSFSRFIILTVPMILICCSVLKAEPIKTAQPITKDTYSLFDIADITVSQFCVGGTCYPAPAPIAQPMMANPNIFDVNISSAAPVVQYVSQSTVPIAAPSSPLPPRLSSFAAPISTYSGSCVGSTMQSYAALPVMQFTYSTPAPAMMYRQPPTFMYNTAPMASTLQSRACSNTRAFVQAARRAWATRRGILGWRHRVSSRCNGC